MAVTKPPERKNALDLTGFVPLPAGEVAKVVLHVIFQDPSKRVLHDFCQSISIIIAQLILYLSNFCVILRVHEVVSLLNNSELFGNIDSLLRDDLNIYL